MIFVVNIQVTQIEIFSRDFLDFKYKNASLSAVPYPIQDCDNTSSTITYLGIQPNCTSMATRACVMHLIMEGIKAASVKPLCFHQMTFHNHGCCEIKQCSYVSDMWTGLNTSNTHTQRDGNTLISLAHIKRTSLCSCALLLDSFKTRTSGKKKLRARVWLN